MSELWKPIENFENNYKISSYGNIQNIKTGKILKPCNKGGYFNISIIDNNKIKKCFYVHRLVANAFIENPENKKEVNHKDKNKINNNVNNLEWNTRIENSNHRCKNLLIKTNKNKVVLRLDNKTGDILEKYNSIKEAGIWAFNNNFTKTPHNGRNAIGNNITGLSLNAYGFKWVLEEIEEIENEIWKNIKINNDEILQNTNYQVSNLGRYKNYTGKIIENYKITECKKYIRVIIKNKTYYLHRLIALTFLENPENKEQVNHIDGNKLNNCVNNLEWVTNKENQIHKFKSGLGNNFTRKITQFDLYGNKIKDFNSIISASKELNICKNNIWGVLNKYTKTTKGFIFKYLDE